MLRYLAQLERILRSLVKALVTFARLAHLLLAMHPLPARLVQKVAGVLLQVNHRYCVQLANSLEPQSLSVQLVHLDLIQLPARLAVACAFRGRLVRLVTFQPVLLVNIRLPLANPLVIFAQREPIT